MMTPEYEGHEGTPEPAVPEMRGMPDIYPHREDQVEAWLKHRRDQWCHPETGTPMESDQEVAYAAVDALLNEWRLASDTGQSVENLVNGIEPPRTNRPLKKKRI